MSNILIVKCYLADESNKDHEIRRFSVESGVIGNFTYLQEKARSVYPQLLRENFSLSYIDDENDRVTISSDEELLMALMCSKRQNGEPFRFYLNRAGSPKSIPPVPSTASGSPNGNLQGEVHRMVTCDGCEGEVRGFRYKCCQCPDFDLCGKCESAGIHPGHTMIRVSGLLPPYFPSIRQLANTNQTREFGHGRGGRVGRGCGFNRRPQQPQNFGHWNDWFQQAGAVVDNKEKKEESKDKKELKEEMKEKKQAEDNACPWKVHMDQVKRAADTLQQTNGSEFLQGLGQTISSILEQFGVDTQVDVHVPGQVPPCAQGKKTEEAEKPEKVQPTKEEEDEKKAIDEAWTALSKAGWSRVESATTPVATNPLQERIIPIQVEEPAPVQPVPAGVSPAKSVAPVAEVVSSPYEQVTAQLNEAVNVARAAEQVALAAQVAQVASVADLPTETAQERSISPESSVGQYDDWNMVGQDGKLMSPRGQEPSAAAAVAAAAAAAVPVQVPAPVAVFTPATPSPSASAAAFSSGLGVRPKMQPVAAPSHPDPLIAGALDMMLAMGFTNEGGWLAQLLEVKGGDIDKVLEVLQPVQRH